MFIVNTEKLARFASSLQQTKGKQQNLGYVYQQFAAHIKTSVNAYLLQDLSQNLTTLGKDLSVSFAHFQNGITKYMKMEQALMDAIPTLSNQSLQQLENSFIIASTNRKRDNGYRTIQKNTFTHHKHTTLYGEKSLVNYVRNGIRGGVSGSFTAYEIQAGKNASYAQGGVGAALGSAHAALDVRGTLFDKGKLTPTLHLESEVGASLAKGEVHAGIENKYLHAIGEVSLAIGAITGHVKAVINKKEVSLKAEVGAAAVRGEVRGVISIFGINIRAIGVGELGSAGASAEFSSKQGEFEFGGKVSFLAGLGFKIKVTY